YWPLVWPRREGVPGMDDDHPTALGAILGLSSLLKDVLAMLRELTTTTPGFLGKLGELLRAGETTALLGLVEFLEDLVEGTRLELLVPKIPGLSQLATNVRTELQDHANERLDDQSFRR